MKRIAVVGASDQGRVVIDLIGRLGASYQVTEVVDSSPDGTLSGTRLGPFEVRHNVSTLGDLAGLVDGVVPAVGSALERERISVEATRVGLKLLSLVHPSAIVASGVELAPGSVVCAGAVLGVDAQVGRGVIINSGAVVDHDCVIGDFAHIAPGATLAGGVSVGRRTWIGVGATVLDDIEIGLDVIVGAAALVHRNVPDGVTVFGVPARVRVQPDE